MRKGKRFLINAIILTATSLVLRTLGVGFNVYISGKIGSEGMGVFQLLMSVYMLGVTLATSGASLATTRLVAEELAKNSAAGARAVMFRCILYCIFFSSVSSLALGVAAPYIASSWLGGKISALPVYALAGSLPPLALSSVLGGYFTAVRRVAKSSSAAILEQLIKISLVVYALNLVSPVGLDYACLSLVLGGVVAEFLSCIYLFFLYLLDRRRYKKGGAVDPTLTRRMLKIALPVAFSSYLRSALNTYKQIIVPLRLSLSGLTYDGAISKYGLIRGMVFPILMFPSALLSAFSSLIIPEIAESHVQKNHVRIDYMMGRVFKITLLFSVCVGGLLFNYSEALSMIFYKSLESAIFIKALAPLVVVMYFDDIVDAILKGLGEQVHVVKINIYDTIVGIILLYTALPIFGVAGYVVVIYITEILNGFLSIGRLLKVTGFKLRLIWWLIIPFFAIIIALELTQMLISSGFYAAMVFAVCTYIAILYVVGAVVKEDFLV